MQPEPLPSKLFKKGGVGVTAAASQVRRKGEVQRKNRGRDGPGIGHRLRI